MRLTNEFNTPEIFMRALQGSSWKPNKDRLSVTTLCQPPMIRHLTIEHWDELSVEASDLFYRLDGSALHYVLEKAAEGCVGIETELSLQLPKELFGMVISGRLDEWNMLEDSITDAKNTGVMGVARGIKDDWVIQANVYRFMVWKLYNHAVKKLRVAVKLRDWLPSNAGRDDYPSSPFAEFAIPLWDFDKVEAYIQSRVDLYMQEEVPMCTDEERWKSPDCFAVKRKGVKKAVAATIVVGDKRIAIPTEAEANAIILKKGGTDLYVEHRPGGYRRCDAYCDCRTLCRKYNPGLWE